MRPARFHEMRAKQVTAVLAPRLGFQPGGTGTEFWENLYQAFKARCIAELRAEGILPTPTDEETCRVSGPLPSASLKKSCP
jgi:hypothetical protein